MHLPRTDIITRALRLPVPDQYACSDSSSSSSASDFCSDLIHDDISLVDQRARPSDSRPVALQGRDIIITIAHRDIPSLGGSTNAFIALVTILGSITLLAGAAALYLWLRQEDSPDGPRERSRRKARHADDLASSSPYNYTASSGGRGHVSLVAKLRAFFARSRRVARPKKKHSTPKRAGWTQASEDDEWEIRSEDELEEVADQPFDPVKIATSPQRFSTVSGYNMPEIDSYSTMQLGAYAPPKLPYYHHHHSPSGASEDGVEDAYQIVAMPFPEPYHGTVGEIPRAESPDQLGNTDDSPDGHQRATRSTHMRNLSERTIDSGTKFIESL